MSWQQNIFVIYYPPYLLKNIRNNFKKGDFVLHENKIRWQHIVDFYNFDKSQQIQIAPNLRDRHIELPSFLAKCVNLAAQVLTHSVAAGIATLVTLKHLPESAIYMLSLLNT